MVRNSIRLKYDKGAICFPFFPTERFPRVETIKELKPILESIMAIADNCGVSYGGMNYKTKGGLITNKRNYLNHFTFDSSDEDKASSFVKQVLERGLARRVEIILL